MLRDRLLLILLAGCIAGMITLVFTGFSLPRLVRITHADISSAYGTLPSSGQEKNTLYTYTIHQSETRHARSLKKALDRIGFDLDAVAAGYISVPCVLLASLPPDLDSLSDTQRRSLFLRVLLPVVLAVNDHIGNDRIRLMGIRTKIANGDIIGAEDVRWIVEIADTYDHPNDDLNGLLRKIDVIPPSLALAQAIEETGWGTSRIARRQNALFGQFGQAADGGWDYRDFNTLTEAVESYMHNLNTHWAYRDFRYARSKMRKTGEDLDAQKLAETLHHYSETGNDYVQALQSIIVTNELQVFDAARLNGRTTTTIIAQN